MLLGDNYMMPPIIQIDIQNSAKDLLVADKQHPLSSVVVDNNPSVVSVNDGLMSHIQQHCDVKTIKAKLDNGEELNVKISMFVADQQDGELLKKCCIQHPLNYDGNLGVVC